MNVLRMQQKLTKFNKLSRYLSYRSTQLELTLNYRIVSIFYSYDNIISYVYNRVLFSSNFKSCFSTLQ